MFGLVEGCFEWGWQRLHESDSWKRSEYLNDFECFDLGHSKSSVALAQPNLPRVDRKTADAIPT